MSNEWKRCILGIHGFGKDIYDAVDCMATWHVADARVYRVGKKLLKAVQFLCK